MLEFRLLGAVRATDDGREIPLGGVKQRSLLALLLLHAGTVLSSDRLIDELWADAPPGDAATALQAHVSRLRRALSPHEVIITRAPGYVVENAVVDADRFRALAAEGRHAEALALWTGPALDDVRYEPWAAAHADALDEERLDVLEARIDADLATGRDVLAEVHRLTREHPLRERARGQLMLALYRAGRHTEALSAYADYRERLDAELGLEPGPELRRLQERILGHDPELGGRRAPVARMGRRAPLALAGVAALLAMGVGLAVGGGGEQRDAADPRDGGTLVVLDARSGEPRERFAVGATPAAVALGEGAAWVVDADGQTVSRVTEDGDVDTFGTGATPTGVATGEGSVWVGAGEVRPGGQAAGPITTGLAQVDPGARTVRARVDLPAGASNAHVSDQAVAVAGGAVWAIAPDGRLVRIAGEARTPVRGPRALAVSASGDEVWVLGESGEVGRVDMTTRRVADPVKIGASSLGGLAADEGRAWVVAPADGTLWRIDAGTPPSTRTIDVGVGASGVAAGAGAVWVTNPLEGTVVRVDPATNRVTQRVRLDGTPRGVAAAGDRVVVAVTGDAPAATSVAGGLPRATCGPVLTAGGGRPERLIVSDLPLQGGLRLSTQQMVQAIELVLREHSFRAGRYRLGYQSCDDSIARTGLFDEAKCAANARLYARSATVIGVVGQVNSPCTAAALPATNRAGLALVSPLSSAVPLTRGSPAELTRLYPTGRRTFARVFGADDHQAQALAALARDLGAKRVATIDDGTAEYGVALARVFERSATARGLEVVATERWRPGARSHAGVAARIARRKPQAVMISGLLDNGGPAVVKALRAALGPDVALLLVDGLTPTDLLVDEAGEAARGAYLSFNGLTPDQFGPAGERFAAKLGAVVPGAEIEPSALYAAAATEVLLDAIARSDGTRASVAGVLHETRLDTVVGRLSFTPAGDPVGSPVTIVRLRPGARDDAVFDRLVRP